ncbi:MAG: arylesterase [Lysobacteraceae bacterium]
MVFAAALLCGALLCAPIAHSAAANKPKPAQVVLVMGDSLSAAYGLAESQGWVALTAQKMASERPDWRIVNASISGETTAGGASRIARELALHRPNLLVIELGANDALRGLPLAQMRANLLRMISAAQAAKANVLLIGMRIPPNYGPAYTREFEASFRTVAEQKKVALLPFLLEPVARDRTAFQDDNLHPVASAEPKVRDHVWVALEPLLSKHGAASK